MRRLISCLVISIIILTSISVFSADKITLDELLKKHLESIGTADARGAAKARAATGKFTMQVIQGGTGEDSGDAGIISAGKMVKVLMKTNSLRYAGEKFWYDGKHVVAPVTDVASRTYLADFLYRNESILRDGLFTGSISTSWALLDVNNRGAKLVYDGIKKIDGQELHQVTYVPKKSASELEVRLYFDPQTFQHVMTRYRYEIAGYMNLSRGSVDRQQATSENVNKSVYTIEEKFSGFQTTDGITLPTVWETSYQVEPVRAILMRWKVELTRVTPNPNFDLKAVFPEQ